MDWLLVLVMVLASNVLVAGFFFVVTVLAMEAERKTNWTLMRENKRLQAELDRALAQLGYSPEGLP